MTHDERDDALVKVWVPTGDLDNTIFEKAELLNQIDGSSVYQVKINNETKDIELIEINKCNPPQFDYCDDMASLTYLNEPSVINNLKLRYQKDQIYTHSGLFLVAINPYRSLNIYNKDFINLYRNSTDEVKLKPHIFGTAQLAVENLIEERKDQSILVTGESGAGKTENTKKVIQYILSVTTNEVNKENALVLESQIIQANPILESFGNATTVRNLNSSRFGKFVKINIDAAKSELSGAYINWYLLEKSRVITQNPMERNYHVFYQLLKGASTETLEKLKLDTRVQSYDYLNKGLTSNINSIDDKAEFQNLLKAFNVMKFTKNDTFNIFKILSIILHLGNIHFKNMSNDKQAVLDESSEALVCVIAGFLGVSQQEFRKVLLNSNFKVGREIVSQQRTSAQAKFAIDALAKTLYEKLFQFLIDRINTNFNANSLSEFTNYIGILDIAGFEIFEKNSFEQLCINYTNEKLQQFFNHHMFVLEQSEYLKEGISWQYIDFGNELKPTIELIEGSKGKTSIFSILDEECVVPKGSDKSFIDKLFKELESKDKNKQSLTFKPNKIRDGFIVKHYAGEVDYSVDEWIDKNKDPLSSNMIELLSNSKDFMIMDFFEASVVPNVSDSPTKTSPRKRKSGIFRTVAQRHKEQLDSLMTQLSNTHPHFVRCILPNSEKKADFFNDSLVLDQLRCNGVLEGIRIARSGYPNRMDFKAFATYYSILASNFYSTKTLNSNTSESEFKKLSELILKGLNLEEDQFKVGISKLFFRNGVLANLEKQRDIKLKEIFTNFNAILRSKLVKSSINKQIIEMKASKVLTLNMEAIHKLESNPWFKLICKIRPTLDDSKANEVQFTTKIKKLEQDLKELQVKLKEKDEIVSKIDDLQLHIKNDQSIIQNKDEQLNEAKKTIVNLEKNLIETKQILEELQSESTLKSSKIDQLALKAADVETRSKKMRSDLEKERKAKSMLDSDIKALKISLDQKEKELIVLNMDKKSSFTDLEKKFKSVEGKLQDALKDNKIKDDQLSSNEKLLNQHKISLYEKEQEIKEINISDENIRNENSKIVKELNLLITQNKELESMRLAYEQSDKIKKKYKQLKHDFRETKILLEKKVNEEVEFNSGRQFYLQELEETKKIVAGLKEQLNVEKKTISDLENKLKVMELSRDKAIKDKKQMELQVSQMKMRISTSPDVVKEISFIGNDNFENNQLNNEIRILRTRLASESYENRQMKQLIRKHGIEWSTSSLSTVNAADEMFDDSEELKGQLKLEKEANERLQSRYVKLQKDLLQYRSNARDSMISYSTMNQQQPQQQPFSHSSTHNYQDKYENLLVEMEHKDEVIGNLKNQLKRMEIKKQRITSIHKQQTNRGILGDITLSNKVNEQAQENISIDKESASFKQENLRLNSQIIELKTRLKRFEVNSDYKFDKEEQLVQLRNGMKTLELKNSTLESSLELYKDRSNDYFDKLSKAEVDVESATRERMSLEIEIRELKNKLSRVINQRDDSENKINGLNEKIRGLERDVSDKVFEIKQLKEDNENIKDKYDNMEEFRKSTSELIKEHRDQEVDRLQRELVLSMNREGELSKQLRNIGVQLDKTKNELQMQKNRNAENVKEVNVLKRALNECMSKNDGLLSKIKEHLTKCNALSNQINTMKAVNEDLVKERDELLVLKRSLEDKLYQNNKVYEEHMKQAKNDAENSILVEQLKEKVGKYELVNNDLQTLVANHQRENSDNKMKNERLSKENMEAIEDNKKLTKYNESLQITLNETKEKVANELTSKEAYWKKRINELEDKLFISTASSRTESHKMESLERAIRDLEIKNDDINRGYKRSLEEIKTLEENIERLRVALRSAGEREAQCQLKCKQLQRVIDHHEASKATDVF